MYSPLNWVKGTNGQVLWDGSAIPKRKIETNPSNLDNKSKEKELISNGKKKENELSNLEMEKNYRKYQNSGILLIGNSANNVLIIFSLIVIFTSNLLVPFSSICTSEI